MQVGTYPQRWIYRKLVMHFAGCGCESGNGDGERERDTALPQQSRDDEHGNEKRNPVTGTSLTSLEVRRGRRTPAAGGRNHNPPLLGTGQWQLPAHFGIQIANYVISTIESTGRTCQWCQRCRSMFKSCIYTPVRGNHDEPPASGRLVLWHSLMRGYGRAGCVAMLAEQARQTTSRIIRSVLSFGDWAICTVVLSRTPGLQAGTSQKSI